MSEKDEKRQFTVVCSPDLYDRARAHRARVELSTGLRVSLSSAVCQLIERGLRETERKLEDGRKR